VSNIDILLDVTKTICPCYSKPTCPSKIRLGGIKEIACNASSTVSSIYFYNFCLLLATRVYKVKSC